MADPQDARQIPQDNTEVPEPADYAAGAGGPDGKPTSRATELPPGAPEPADGPPPDPSAPASAPVATDSAPTNDSATAADRPASKKGGKKPISPVVWIALIAVAVAGAVYAYAVFVPPAVQENYVIEEEDPVDPPRGPAAAEPAPAAEPAGED